MAQTFARAFANYKPPENLTLSEWAAKYRILARESSAEAGVWSNDRTPYLVEPMDAFTDSRVNQITIVAGSQSGKSEVELNAIGYIIDQDPGSILYAQPNLNDAKKFSRLRIAPMIRECPNLRRKVSDVKKENGNTILQKSFPGGMLTMVGSNSASALASTPVRYVIGDELDRWALSAGTEGDPWSLAEARTTTFYNAKRIAVSTPTIKGFSKIESLYYEGTQERWQHKCPECGAWHAIGFNDIKFAFDPIKHKRKTDYVVKTVGWCCPSCGCLSDESKMRQQPARWHAENPEAIQKGHRSFWINAFSTPWRSWHKITYLFLTSHKDPQKLKVFYNTILGEPFEDRGDLQDEDIMLSRREDYGTREGGAPVELPKGVLVLTCGVDTQGDRLEYEVVGHGRFGETWGIKRGIILGDPNEPHVWSRLDDVIEHEYAFESGQTLRLSCTFVDSGGNKTQSVYRECGKRFHKKVFASKGRGGDGIPYTRKPNKVDIMAGGRAVGKAYLYILGVDAGKSMIMDNLKVQEAGPKYCHFPLGMSCGYDSTYFSGLLSEKLSVETVKGKKRWAWVKLPGHARNEALDCRNYALAAFYALDPDLDAVERRIFGEKREAKESPMKKDTLKTKRIKRNRSFDANDW